MGRRSVGLFSICVALFFGMLLAMPFGWQLGISNNAEAAPGESVLDVGFMQSVDSLNPFIGLSYASHFLYGLVYDCLQGVGNDLEPVPNIAREWRVVPSELPYGSVWEYNLTANAVWTDGVPLTADDVVYTINLSADNYWTMWAYQPYAYRIDYAEAIDQDTVWIHFYDPESLLPAPVAYATQLSMPIMPKHKLESMDPTDIGFSWNGLFPEEDPPLVGSGPFMATANISDEWLIGDYITLVKNPDYHFGPDMGMYVNFDTLIMHFYDDSTAMRLALESGVLDAAEFPPNEYLQIKNDVEAGTLQDVDVFDGLAPDGYWEQILVCMNNAGPNPSRLDLTIRKAMAMATNKTYIVDSYYLGLGEEGSTLIGKISDWHYEPTVGETFPFDPVAASAMLEAAGYRDTDSDGTRECTASSWAVQQGLVPEGTPLVYEMLVRVEHPEEKDVAMYLAATWQGIGIDINYQIVNEAMLSTIVYSYSYDTAIWYWSHDVDPNYMLFCQSEAAINGWSDNKWSNQSYEENYSLSVSALDPVARKTYVDNCQRIHYLDVGYIIFANVYQTYAWRTDTFVNWGDWAKDPGRSMDACWGANPLYFDLVPVTGNSPPCDLVIEPIPESPLSEVPVVFSVSATDLDGDPLDLYIEFGDGSGDTTSTPGGTEDPQTASFTHTYATGGNFTVTLWADDGNGTQFHNASRSILLQVIGPVRSVTYRWYDMFNVPFGEWWDMRWEVYRTDEPLTDSFPYIFRTYGNPPGNVFYQSNMRLDITARNLPELNMTSRPLFLPFLGTERGGNATIDWHMQYLTRDEMARYPGYTLAWEDGWVICLNGTATLDRQAAMAVLGVTPAGYDDFANWWAANENSVELDYNTWWRDEGNDRLDIYNMYEYPLTFLVLDLEAARIGDNISLTFDVVTWGMESMMARWFRDAFMPNEWYWEDMNLHAVIGPDMTDIDVTTAVDYSLYAWETTVAPPGQDYGLPCWVWEGMLGDNVESSISHPKSDFDPYADKEYRVYGPGNLWYDIMMPYDYTPGALNLSLYETLVFEWPVGVAVQFKEQARDNVTGDPIIGEVNNITAGMSCNYSEPMASDNPDLLPGSVHVDASEGTITFVGPIDIWQWSKDQTAHQFLADEWTRVGLMPYGMPCIEFGMANGTPPIADFMVTPSTGNVSTVFLFDASTSWDLEDPPEALEVRWDWEDDSVWDTAWSTQKTETHQYSAPGNYAVRLAVRDTQDNTDEFSATVEVVNTAPVALFTVYPTSGGNITLFEFNASLSYDLEDAAVDLEVRWDWENDDMWDISWTTTKNATHMYERAGVYNVELEVRDTMGLVGSAVQDVTVTDIHAPTTEISFAGTMGNMGWYVSEVTVTLTASDDDSPIASTMYRVDSGTWLAYSTPFIVSAEGDHVVEFYSADSAGNTELTKSENLPIDLGAPVTSMDVSGTLGENGWYVADITVTLSIGADVSGLDSTHYTVDGGAVTEYTAPFVVAGDGEHVITYYSVDIAGNSENAQVSYVKLDTAAPETTISAVGSLTTSGWYSTAVSVTLTCAPDTSDINHTYYRLGSGSWELYTAPFTVSTSGIAQVQAWSVDLAGNAEAEVSLDLLIDLVAPSLSASEPTFEEDGTVIVSWTFADAHSGMNHIETSLDGAAFVGRGNASSLSLTELELGSHTVVIRAVDNVGNSAEVTVTFEIEEEEGSVLLYVVPAAIAAIAIALVALLMLRKRRSGPGQEETPRL